MCDVSSRNGDTLRIRLSPSLAWHSGPTTRQPRQRQKLSTTVWRTFPNFIPCCWAWGPQTLGESSPSTNSSVLPDRLLTRLSALYCQRSRVRRRFCWKIQAFYSWRKLLSRCRYKPLKSKTIPRMTPIIRLHELIFSHNAGLIQ